MYGGIFAAARSSAQSKAAIMTGHRAAGEASQARSDVEAMEFEVERLLMITEALWLIIKEQLGYEDEELMRRIEEIDMRDGRLDGKVKPETPPECPECGRTLIGKRPKCLYCGVDVKRDPFER